MKRDPEIVLQYSIALAVALMAILILSACGAEFEFVDEESFQRQPNAPAHVYARTDARALPVVQEFIRDCGRYGRGAYCGGELGRGEKIVVLPELAPTKDGKQAAGYCRKRDRWDERASWAIELRADIFDDEAYAKTVIYHELGHCVLGLDHDTMGDNPIMNPEVADPGAADNEADLLSLFSARG